jgi:hypothetical protein
VLISIFVKDLKFEARKNIEKEDLWTSVVREMFRDRERKIRRDVEGERDT